MEATDSVEDYFHQLVIGDEDGTRYVFYHGDGIDYDPKEHPKLALRWKITPVDNYKAYARWLKGYVCVCFQAFQKAKNEWDSSATDNCSFQRGVRGGIVAFKKIEFQQIKKKLEEDEEQTLISHIATLTKGEEWLSDNRVPKNLPDLVTPVIHIFGRLSSEGIQAEITQRWRQIQELSGGQSSKASKRVDERAYQSGKYQGYLTLMKLELCQCVEALIELGLASVCFLPATNSNAV